MDKLINILIELKKIGASGIKISFEDEGALLNEMTTMRYLTAYVGLEMSVKIGGCEAKRDICDCNDLCTDSIVAPMVESKFSLQKFIQSVKQYNYKGKIGFNLETINSYNNLEELNELFDHIDFVTFGRVDFVGSLNKTREFVDSEEVYNMVKNVYTNVKNKNKKCYLGGAISIKSSEFIKKLLQYNLLDKFETRYIIFNAQLINDFEYALYIANVFEVEWMKYISDKYNEYSMKDKKRIKMIEDRLENNKFKKII
jgi:4-hydroxy-2-oxoheptanedioate aldolase